MKKDKWGIFVKVDGVWRFEGFVDNTKAVAEAARTTRRENGEGTFYSILLTDDRKED